MTNFIILLAQKPIQENYACNCSNYGCGGINIDGCRIGNEKVGARKTNKDGITRRNMAFAMKEFEGNSTQGRWPTNFLWQENENIKKNFPNTHGAGSKQPPQEKWKKEKYDGITQWGKNKANGMRYGDAGSTSRFFKSFTK